VDKVGLEESRATTINIVFFPAGKITSVPRDATAFFNRGNWIEQHVRAAYHSEHLDGWVKDWAHRWAKGVAEAELETSTETPPGYFWEGDGEEATAVFGGNYARLRALKKKYDAEMIFHSWYPITPAE
jgi:Berberine and berberine like